MFMVLYVVYEAPREFKNRGLITRRLKMLGCRRVGKFFWALDDNKVNAALKVVSRNKPILLKRIREIRKSRFDDENNLVDFGSLVIVAYSAKKDGKGRVRSALKKTPCIRLCRSVYAFSQNTSNEKKDDLIDVRLFFNLVKEVDVDTMIIPRMIIADNHSTHMLLEKVRLQVEKEVGKAIDDSKRLMERIEDGEADEKWVKEEERKLYDKLLLMNRLANFYREWLGVDLAGVLMRTYSVIRKLRSVSVHDSIPTQTLEISRKAI